MLTIKDLSTTDFAEFSKTDFDTLFSIAESAGKYLLATATEITSSDQFIKYLAASYGNYEHEVFGVIFLTTKHQIIGSEIMARGTIGAATVYPREVLKSALANNAAAVLVFHNHPSGSSTPSSADIEMTRRLKEVLSLVEINVLDHAIVTKAETTLFSKNGLL